MLIKYITNNFMIKAIYTFESSGRQKEIHSFSFFILQYNESFTGHYIEN